MSKTLTEKQLAFVREYTVDFNGQRAAERAGYSKNGARAKASNLLANEKVQRELQRRIKQREKRVEVSADKIVDEWATIAFTNLTDFLTWDETGKVRIKPVEELTEDQLKCLSKIKFNDEGQITEFSVPKMQALDKLAKTLGMYVTRKEISGPNGGPIELNLTHDVALNHKRKIQAISRRIVEENPPSRRASLPISQKAEISKTSQTKATSD